MIPTHTTLTDRYQIEELLSHKAGRQTFLAKDLHSQTPVIIKLLRFGDGFEWDDLKLFEREAATLKNIDRPEIPKYLDYFDVDEVDIRGFALVQSYIEAPSLATWIARGRKFSEAEVIELADRLLALLAYLHQQHPPVIHRDIKPSNILLSNRSGNSIGDIYLVDFGSVQTVAKKEEGTITIVGSYGYIPLEQFGGQTTTASDLYSLGMTLVYLLTGTHPAELPQVDGRVKFNAEISKKFERWLEKMIQPYLDKRFESAKVARVALKSEDGSYGEFDRLKPAQTQIGLYRDRDKLQITWHETNPIILCLQFVINIVLFFTVAIGGTSLLALFVVHVQQPTTVRFLFVCLSAFCIVCFPFKLISQKIVECLSIPKIKHYLTINDRSVCKLKNDWYEGQPIKLSEHPRSQVKILAYNPGYTFNNYLDANSNIVRSGSITISPKLLLYCGSFEYSFPAQFSRAELWWLGKELSDFLNLELQVIYPTPIVPPVPSCGGGC